MSFPFQKLWIAGPFQGLNDSENPLLLEDAQLSLAQNVTFEDGAITKARGTVALGNAVATATTTWGVHDFVSRDGTKQFIRMLQTAGGTALYVFNSGTSNWDIKGAAADYGNALMSFVTWPSGAAAGKSLLFIADKSGTVRSKWDGTNRTAWGLAAPAAVPTFNANINGALTAGTYLYRITYYNSTSAEESNPTAASVAMTALADPNDGIRINIPADGAFDVNAANQVRVYRTTVGGAVYYLDGTVAYAGAGTTFDSILSDISLTAGGTLLETDNDVAPGLKYIVLHKQRMFGAGASANPQNLYYSKLNEPENWPTLNFQPTYNPQQGGLTDITGLLPFRDQLYVFTRDQMWILRGTVETDFLLERLPQGLGCVSHHTVKTFQNVVLWWSEVGPVIWDGATFQFPGRGKLDALMKWTAANATDWTNAGSPAAIDPDRMDSMVSEILKVGGRLQYWTAYTSRTGSTNDRILVYDFAQEAWSIPLIPTASMGVVEDATTDMDRLFLGGYTGTVREANRAFAYEGGAISAIADTRWFDMKLPSHRKKLRGLVLWLKAYDASLAAHNLTVRWYFDFSATQAGITTVAVPATRARHIYFPLRGKFEHVRFRFEQTAASADFSIDGFEIQFRQQPALREVAA